MMASPKQGTVDTWTKIRPDISAGILTHGEIAKKYGVSLSQARHALYQCGKRYIGMHRGRKIAHDYTEVDKLITQGFGGKEIAARTGMNAQTINWRARKMKMGKADRIAERREIGNVFFNHSPAEIMAKSAEIEARRDREKVAGYERIYGVGSLDRERLQREIGVRV